MFGLIQKQQKKKERTHTGLALSGVMIRVAEMACFLRSSGRAVQQGGDEGQALSYDQQGQSQPVEPQKLHPRP